ncbi:MAG: HD domain-containing phosphohydrolase [Halioglobus sp.]
MKNPFAKFHTTIRWTVTAGFIISTLLTAALAISLQYYFGKSMAKEAATRLYESASSGIAAEITGIGRLNVNIIDLLADNAAFLDSSRQPEQLRTFIDVMRNNPLFYAAYLGRDDGSFFEVINLETGKTTRETFGALPEHRWLSITLRPGAKRREFLYQYLTDSLEVTQSRTEATDFQVKARPWFVSAINSNDVQRSDPYRFAQLGLPGRTVSKRIAGSGTVVAIDMTLSTMSRFLQKLTIADQGDVYLYNADGQVIASSLDHGDGVISRIDGVQGSTLPGNELLKLAANPGRHGKLAESLIGGELYLVYSAPTGALEENPLFIGIVAPVGKVLAPYLKRVKLSIVLTGLLLLLLLPLSWLFATPIVRPVRQLAVENDKVRRRQFDEVERISSHVKEIDELSESMVSMVAAIRSYELAQRNLMDSFIRLIAEAIDDKSAYTGGHCERVPELALMLAEKASQSEAPAFRGFHLETDDQWREYYIAAWLHDCGKITTPEHIVDKGTKLETIYNRIHEVRMRFEVLWRDAEIDYLKGVIEEPSGEGRHLDALQAQRETLQEEFTFIAECNVGGEFLGEEKQQRLRKIAERTWERHFDDRIGLSPVEERRLPPAAAPLPATEHLLSDKPEHIVERPPSGEYPAEFGIRMEAPEHLYNLGEIYNLSVSRGTLTAEDRFKINEHIISTIKMLESLPFPDELKNVPRYASTHHETMRGSGYPRRLSGDQLSIPERILAVADVFEALTASDRPYKKPKPVSVAIDILHRMVVDNHIDRDCFELFLREGVYAAYADRFLTDDQNDEVDTAKYL